jgi:hypothetical protein
MNNEINFVQLSLIKKSKKYLSNCKRKGIDIALSPFCDLTTWINSLGYQKLHLINENKFFSKGHLRYFLSEILNIGRFNFNYYVYNNNLYNKKKINIIYSYSWKENFKNGIFFDNYFKVSSEDKNLFFILNSIDGFLPKKVKNCVIITRNKIFFNPLLFFNHLFKKVFCKNFFHKFNSTNIFNEFIQKVVQNELPEKIVNVLIPYENRPHQNAFIIASNNKNPKNKIICYLHNMPWPFQLDMIYKKIKINKLFVCSNIQKKVFIENYSWPKNIVKTISSLRFKVLKNRKKTIFLPFDLTEDNEKLLDGFKVLISRVYFDLHNYKISIHPLKLFAKEHLNFKKRLLEIVKNSKTNKLKVKITDPIIFSHPGGTASECLQVCNSTYHITTDKLHVFSRKIWNSIKILKIDKNVYKYVSKNTKFLILDKKNSIKNFI